jgi:hypothetical protein
VEINLNQSNLEAHMPVVESCVWVAEKFNQATTPLDGEHPTYLEVYKLVFPDYGEKQ